MKILVGNNAFGRPGGSETYAFAIIKELVRRGIQVEAIAKRGPGIVSEKIRTLGVPVHFKPVSGNFDLILASHTTSIAMMKNVRGFKVQTCHGVFPKLEQPVAGMDIYVAISEEVHDHLASKGYSSVIIRNGIDCGRFKPKSSLNENLKTVLSLAQSDTANEIIRKACNKIGCEMIENNKFKVWKWDMENIVDKADLVISLGRGAYEAMAAGKNVVIFDKRNYVKAPAIGDGILTIENVGLYLKNNCTGRYTNKEYNAEILADEILKYDPKHGKDLREYAIENLNIERQVEKYLSLVK